jgi:hypothetical protein
MSQRLRCSSVTIDPDMLLPRALPGARFDRNATTSVTDLVH